MSRSVIDRLRVVCLRGAEGCTGLSIKERQWQRKRPLVGVCDGCLTQLARGERKARLTHYKKRASA